MGNKTTFTIEPGTQEIRVSREFDAPRELVFRAYTDPKLIIQWLGPRDLTMTLQKFEMKSQGSYRYIHARGKDQFAFSGVVHSVQAPDCIVQTFEFEGAPGHVSLETSNFESLPGNRTRVTTQSVFQSVADRDNMARSGMDQGVKVSYERLDEVLQKIR